MSPEIGVIGGGIVGVALARRLALDGAGTVTLLEKERRLALHQTGRNSGVVHAGLYYAPGSLKSRLCAEGRRLLQQYCLEHSLPYRALGKLVVAVDDTELPALAALEDRGRQGGVPGLVRLDRSDIERIEPHAAGVAALHSPSTAVVDYAAITESLATELRQNGGEVLLDTEATGIRRQRGRIEVRTRAGVRGFDRLFVCGGLQSDRLARMAGTGSDPAVLPFRGEYWAMPPRRRELVRGLIYPVPDPRFPFLGVHFTRGVYNDVRVGPNAVPALAREGYRWRDVSPRDLAASLTWPGAIALARAHGRMGLGELAASLIKPLYLRQARRLLPALTLGDLAERTPAGVRAQAWAKSGALVDDFALDRSGGITVLRNAPSPAATSALAIANHVIALDRESRS